MLSRRRDASHADPSRTAVGVSIASSCQRVRAALIESAGGGFRARATIRAVGSASLPDSLAARLRRFVAGKSDVSVESLGQLRAELADMEVESIQKLSAESGTSPGKILVAGIDDPGLWSALDGIHFCVSLCDPARIAESCGVSVVDGFPNRDLAQGGCGGPLYALPQWILLKDPRENRLLVDLGRTTRMTLLPSDASTNASSRIMSFDVGPGTWLLDELIGKLTGGRHRFDPGGRFAVQGRRRETLLNHWLADSTFSRTSPRWHARGVRPERFLNDGVRMAVEADWSIQDLLCTATHLVAESIVRATQERLPDDVPIHRILIHGGGRHNGMLLAEITARLPGIALSPISELGIADEALSPACAALLALFHLDQVPGNLSGVTGTAVPRVLGRLTPGSPQNWQRLMHHLARVQPTVVPLRSAM